MIVAWLSFLVPTRCNAKKSLAIYEEKKECERKREKVGIVVDKTET